MTCQQMNNINVATFVSYFDRSTLKMKLYFTFTLILFFIRSGKVFHLVEYCYESGLSFEYFKVLPPSAI